MKKNYLYYENSRIKKIRVEIPEFKCNYELQLQDTFFPQKIEIPINNADFLRQSYMMTITILEVYEGSKYKDTCLSGLLFEF